MQLETTPNRGSEFVGPALSSHNQQRTPSRRWRIPAIQLSLGLPFAGISLASAGDWAQWRGPERDGHSLEAGLLDRWPADGPSLLWQATGVGGDGYSSPVVAGSRVFLISNRGPEDERVIALSAKDGAELWSTRIGNVGRPAQRPNYPGSRSSVTVDGDHLYALGSDGDFACVEVASGKVVWRKNVRTEFGGVSGTWAYAESPLVDGDLVVCTPGGPEATLLALNKKTGSVVWKSALPEADAAAYASIVTADILGTKQYVQFLAKGLVGVAADSGTLLWRYSKTADGSPANIPTPIVQANMVYSGANRTGGGLIRLSGSPTAPTVDQVYFARKLPTAIGGAVLVGDHLYGASGQSLLCVDFKSGEVKWEERSTAPGALCYADGLLDLHGESGETALVAATPAGYDERGRFTPPNQPDRGRSKAWAYPAIAHGRLYLRDWTSLWCFDIKGS